MGDQEDTNYMHVYRVYHFCALSCKYTTCRNAGLVNPTKLLEAVVSRKQTASWLLNYHDSTQSYH